MKIYKSYLRYTNEIENSTSRLYTVFRLERDVRSKSRLQTHKKEKKNIYIYTTKKKTYIIEKPIRRLSLRSECEIHKLRKACRL